MSENIKLNYVWDHTIMKILNSKMGNMIKEWVVFNKLEDFNSLLKYTDDDFCTLLETLQNIAAQVPYSYLSVNFTLSLLKVSFPQTMSLSCIFVFAPSFIRMDLSIMTSSTSLTFSEFLVLFSSISLLFSFIERHFAL